MSDIKIIVAEDNQMNQLLIKTIIALQGYTCFIADNGKIAIEELEKNDYDIILMDIMMPIMDGFTAAKYIREKLGNQTIPIIAVTADVTANIKEKCKDAGMNDYISKPYNGDKLIEMIQNYTP